MKKVELFLNGKSLGTKKRSDFMEKYFVPLEGLSDYIAELLDTIHNDMYERQAKPCFQHFQPELTDSAAMAAAPAEHNYPNKNLKLTILFSFFIFRLFIN